MWLNKYKGLPIQFYHRHVGVTFCLSNNKDQVLLFFGFLSSQHDTTNFTMKNETTNSLAFLDVLPVNKYYTYLTNSAYDKKTFTGLLTNVFSIISFSYKLAISEPY